MLIEDVINALESIAPPILQEDYDNAGLITGSEKDVCTGCIVCLDTTEDVIQEAIDMGYNLVVAHHPIVFKGLKKITGKNYVERTIIKAIQNNIAIYAIHTNLDNVLQGVNGNIADKIGLQNCRTILPKENTLRKLSIFVPKTHEDVVLNALFSAGAGNIGKYAECSFASVGTGSFKASEGSKPFVGKHGIRHLEQEAKLEVIYPFWLQNIIISAMLQAHPYEEVAYDIFELKNPVSEFGSGIIGTLSEEIPINDFLVNLSKIFDLQCIKHTKIIKNNIKTIALCGGAGSFLIANAISTGADAYITSDIKYHEFFDADGKILLIDIGHFESEQFTIDLILEVLKQKFPNFATLKTGINTNPVKYWTA